MAFHPLRARQQQPGVSTQEQSAYALLSPGYHPARTNLTSPLNDLSFLDTLYAGQVVAFDLETKGVDPTAPETEVVGIGIASGLGSAYYTKEYYREVVQELADSRVQLVAHNLFLGRPHTLVSSSQPQPSDSRL